MPRFFALMDPAPVPSVPNVGAEGLPAESERLWRIPAEQRFVVEEFDDGIVMFDALVGSTHLLNLSAADALAIVSEFPGLPSSAIRQRLLERLDIEDEALPVGALEELLWRLEDLNLIEATGP
jgi:PqqD family protein of HPr-rel-A system